MEKHLFKIKAGMGDCVQFACVLKHLKQNPDLYVGVETRPGFSPVFHGIADEYHDLGGEARWRLDHWDKRLYMPFERPEGRTVSLPNTKVWECLKRYFPDIEPKEELFRYEINIPDTAHAQAQRYIDTLPGPYGIIHPRGISSKQEKDLTDWEAYCLCGLLASNGLTPVVLCWEYPLPDWIDNETIFCPDTKHELWADIPKKFTGNAAVIASLIDKAEIFFGIDSGPAHLAGCSPINTPAYVIWWETDPFRCFDLSGNPNLVHFVPDDYDLIGMEKVYFDDKYKVTYYPGDMLTEYIEWFVNECK